MRKRHPLLRRVSHIGVVVGDIEETRRWLVDAFGLNLTRRVELSDGKIKGEFFRCGECEIELIEIGDPEVRLRRLGNEKARIEHVAVEVENIWDALGKLAALGAQTFPSQPRRVGDWLTIWTVAETTGGVSYQLVQRVYPVDNDGRGDRHIPGRAGGRTDQTIR
jgi:methylmalonyl-CoA/ethylmalonyl-CoA epimerase